MSRTGTRIALGLAAAAFLLAAVAALLPAKLLRATYSWPPSTLPSASPARTWYSPLLLARHEPGSLSARIPCSLPPALPQASRPLVVLATAREPRSAGGLAVTHTGRSLVVSVGGTTLVRLVLPDVASAPDCAYRLSLSDGTWSVSGASGVASRSGTTAMPVVSGLFSGLDLARGGPSVSVTTTVYASRSTVAQTVLRILAALAAIAALVLVAGVRRFPRPAWRPRGLGLVDAVVVAVLLVWWVLGPAFYDDGWVEAGQQNLGPGGGLSSYFDSFAVTGSLQYWLAWLEHPLYSATSSLLWLRLPALVCLLATWILSRWIFARVAPLAGRAAAWALGTAFLTGALAWGMTLRPEPVVALLVTGVAACTVLFLERSTAGPLAVAVVLVALAVSAHPAGLLTLAPLVVAAPALVRWARPRLGDVGTIVLAGAALVAILLVLGSDLRHLSSTASSLRAFGVENAGWRDELNRYSLLSRDLYGPPLRRLWVVLALLAVFAFLLRPRRDRPRTTLDLPAATVGIGLLLLVVTPAKLPWHFGALIGLAAVALAAETARLVADAGEGRTWHVRPLVVVAAGVVAAAWAWGPRLIWSDLDLRTLHWTLGLERHLTLAKVAGAVPVLVLLALAALAVARGRRLGDAPWLAAAWIVPAVTVPLLLFTLGVFAADTHKTDSWTLARQNADALQDNAGCGLADDALVPRLATMRPTAPASGTPAPWLPAAPVPGLARFALAPGDTGRSSSPWLRLPQGRRAGTFLTGIPSAGETLTAQWRTGGSPAGANTLGGDLTSDARPELNYWRLEPLPTGADEVRFVLTGGGAPGAGLGVTAPVAYDDTRLAGLVRGPEPSLALPNLLPYVPCVRLPPIRRGVAEVPKLLLAFRDTMWPVGDGTSPFDEVTELYRFVRLPLSDSPDPPDDVAVYMVDERIDGGALARAVPSG